MQHHQVYMQRCLELAKKGQQGAAPNPMVGAVIVYNNQIIGEGYHQKYGKGHAEVNAIASVLPKHQPFLAKSTIYVSLEPCSFYGKTPPCADLLIKHKIPTIVIGCLDPFPLVAGRGIKKLKAAGCKVIVGVLERECQYLIRRFVTFHEKKRPYIILKWGETKDGFLALIQPTQKWITNQLSKRVVHKWRAEEQAILVGRKTAQIDNPKLTNRQWYGRHPLRLVFDQHLQLPTNLHIFQDELPTIIFTAKKRKDSQQVKYIQLDFSKNVLPALLTYLYEQKIQSLLVEGGKQVLQAFITQNLWDEARILVGQDNWELGINSPNLPIDKLQSIDKLGTNQLKVFKNS